jgi:multidrug resistance efflux pump
VDPRTIVASAPNRRRLTSLEAYVVPHLVDVAARTHGVVASVAATPHEVVGRGQALAVVERLSSVPGGQGRIVTVTAPVAGVVTRSWATPGDLVGQSWPILTIASAEDVLVVARFPGASSGRLRRGDRATVCVGGGASGPHPATIISVVGPLGDTEAGVAPDARCTRALLSFPNPPAEALWPGIPAQVEIAC